MKSLLSICFRYRALFKYVPQNPDELEMFEGDTVMVLEKCDDGWFVGTSERYGLEKTYMFDLVPIYPTCAYFLLQDRLLRNLSRQLRAADITVTPT